jgi:HEXXH motif-containing protein
VNLLGGGTLPAAAESQYERWLFIRLSGLFDAARINFQGLDGKIDAAERALAILNRLSFAQIVEEGTPFFWMNVHRLLATDSSGPAGPSGSLQYLICHAFDSYFARLADGQGVSFEVEEPAVILLPKLGLRVEAEPGLVHLQKLHSNGVRVEVNGRRSEIELAAIQGKFRFPLLTVAGRDSTKLLLVSHPSLFEQAYIEAVTPATQKAKEQSAMIGDALDLICAAYPSLGQRISTSVKWYVPIATDSLDTHRSFSAASLIGLIFLSEAANELRLAEAIVHEFHHNELFAYSNVAPLIDGPTDRLFYSPWREDARPLYGLIHAVFVFAGVCDFYRRLEQSPAFQRYHEHLWSLHSERVCQLEIGLAQIPEDQLTDAGRGLIASLRSRVEEQRQDLAGYREMPPSIERHLRIWMETHPHLASEVRFSSSAQRMSCATTAINVPIS